MFSIQCTINLITILKILADAIAKETTVTFVVFCDYKYILSTKLRQVQRPIQQKWTEVRILFQISLNFHPLGTLES